MYTFMGRPYEYWTELQRRLDDAAPNIPNMDDLLEEIGKLRGKVSYYESRIGELAAFAKLPK